MKKNTTWEELNSSVNQARISTGIDRLDEIIRGGFLPGRTYLAAGEPGTGKSIFALQFLFAGIGEGRNGVYVSTNERLDDIAETAASLGWDIEQAISNGQLQLLDMSPFFSRYVAKGENKTDSKRNEINIRKVLVELGKYTRAKSATMLVFDSVNAILPSCEESEATIFARELVLSLENYLECTTLLIHDNWEQDRHNQIHPIESHVSGVLHLGMTEQANNLVRSLFIKKVRATPVEPAIHRFSIKPIEGISLSQAADDNGHSENEVIDPHIVSQHEETQFNNRRPLF